MPADHATPEAATTSAPAGGRWFFFASLLSGLAWGGIGALFARIGNLSEFAWCGVAVSPVIGLAIGYASRWLYAKGTPGLWGAVVGSLLFGCGTFGAALSFADWLTPDRYDTALPLMLILGAISALFGLALTEFGAVLVIGLSVLNHLGLRGLLRWNAARSQA